MSKKLNKQISVLVFAAVWQQNAIFELPKKRIFTQLGTCGELREYVVCNHFLYINKYELVSCSRVVM